jgi:hypothetical protein
LANKYTVWSYVTETHKGCSLCKEIKPHSEFHKDKKNVYGKGLGYYCKECANRKSRENHAARIQKNDLEYKQAKRDAYYKTKYGISLQEHGEKLALQQNECAICGVRLSAHGYHTHLDHDHKTGKLRAFLCTNCNRGLGSFMDSSGLLRKAAKYLDTHKNSEDVLERTAHDDCTH